MNLLVGRLLVPLFYYVAFRHPSFNHQPLYDGTTQRVNQRAFFSRSTVLLCEVALPGFEPETRECPLYRDRNHSRRFSHGARGMRFVQFSGCVYQFPPERYCLPNVMVSRRAF